MVAFLLILIICRRGFQKHIDQIYLHVGNIRYFSGKTAMDVMIRTVLYLGAAMTRRGRKFHFEGRNPREQMPPSLKRWVLTCQLCGALGLIFMLAYGIYCFATDQL